MKKIFILGGGYAGVSTALGLKGLNADVTLVNKHSYHYLTTLLHQPVAGRRSYQDLSVELKSILPSPVAFMRGTVDKIDPASSTVSIKTRAGTVSQEYDILVIALGWEPQFYNIPGLKEASLTLHSLNTSRLAKDHIEEALILYDENPEESWRTTIVIGGGGLTGVELTGELIDSRRKLAKSIETDPEQIRLILVEGAPTLLPGLDPWLAEKATSYLKNNDVQCLTDTRITAVGNQALELSNGKNLKAGTVIWTGGVRGNSLLEKNGFPVNRQGRTDVNSFMQAVNHPNIFVAGDCALVKDSQGNPLPPSAWLAVQQGKWVAQNIRMLLAGKGLLPYRPEVPGLIISLGRRNAAGVVAGRRLSGKTAAIIKDTLAFNHLRRIGGFRLVFKKLWEWAPYLIHLHRL